MDDPASLDFMKLCGGEYREFQLNTLEFVEEPVRRLLGHVINSTTIGRFSCFTPDILFGGDDQVVSDFFEKFVDTFVNASWLTSVGRVEAVSQLNLWYPAYVDFV